MKTKAQLRKLFTAAVREQEAARKAGEKDAARALETEVIQPLERAMAFASLQRGAALKAELEKIAAELGAALGALQRSIDSLFLDRLIAEAKKLGVAPPPPAPAAVAAEALATSPLPVPRPATPDLPAAEAEDGAPVFRLRADDWRRIFPKAPQAVIDAFTANPAPLDRAGITRSRTRLAYALANVEHECGGFTIKDLTEDIRYSPERMAEVWPNRFADADAVRAKFGTGAGWRKKAFDEIYGNRMGNRPGTNDGSTFIGRGGPQITGRGGYEEVGARCGLDLAGDPALATKPEHQPAILAAFWEWKGMNRFADAGDFRGAVKAWNGGHNGMADRRQKLKGNDPVISRLTAMATILPALEGA